MSLAALSPRVDDRTRRRWRSLGYWTDEALGWVLETSAAAWPDRVAVVTPDREVTYRELQAHSASVARTLLDHGVGPGDVVSWMLPTDAQAIAVASAIWRIGAVSSPIVPLYGTREMTAVLEQVRPAAIVTSARVRNRGLAEEFDDVLEAIGHRPKARLLCDGAVAGWRPATASGPGALPDGVLPSSGDAPGLILFTSGTESAPKGAVHSIAGIGHEVRSCVSEWGVTFRDRMFMASPMTHITGLLQGYLIPARTGAAAVLMDRWDPVEAVDLIERTGATYMAGATPFLRELDQAYRASGLEGSSIRQYCCGGASVPPQLVRRVGELGIAAYRAWGMTELPTSSFANELDPLDVRADTDGRLAPGVELRVLDDDGRQLPPGEVGSLQLRGPEMMLGYLQTDANERAFSPGGWFHTGDVGTVDGDGCIRISGRTKDIINRGGEKYSAREIEEAVARHPDVAAVAVVAVPGGRLGEQIGAVVVSTRPDLGVAELGRHVTTLGLARQKQPEQLVLVDAIPVNATGKVDKRAVLALLEGGQA
jgi:cyclohexanecarboxylate-CoA ligase